MNKELTKEQFEALKVVEPFLNQSLHDYVVNQSMVNKELVFGIHREIFGGDLGSINCPSCVLKTYKRIADLYFPYKEKLEKEEHPAVEMKDGVITFDFTKAEAEEAELKKRNEEIGEDVVLEPTVGQTTEENIEILSETKKPQNVKKSTSVKKTTKKTNKK